jgi:hypothetical protein
MPSKLTFHIMGFDGKVLDQLQQMQPSTVKLFDFPSDTNIDEIRRRCPNTLLIYRQYTNLTFSNPADQFVTELDDTLNKLKGRGIIWEGLNEPVIKSAAEARALSDWFVRFASLMHAKNEKVAAYSFSTGNPDLSFVPLLVPGVQACDYLAMHEYYYPQVNSGSDLGRYRQFYNLLPADARKPILITETGADDGQNNGWLKYYQPDQFMKILRDYDTLLRQDNYVMGATIFQYGAGDPWKTFDITTIGGLIANYVSNPGAGPANLQDAILAEAKKHTWVPINTNGALFKYAQTQKLGFPQTDEFEFQVGADRYVGQVYNGGIVYVKKGDWGNVKWVKKPAS